MDTAGNTNMESRYLAGFNDCAERIKSYLSTANDIDEDLRNRLINHLFNKINNLSPSHQERIHPAFKKSVQPSGPLATILVPISMVSRVKVDYATATRPGGTSMNDNKENIVPGVKVTEDVWRPWYK